MNGFDETEIHNKYCKTANTRKTMCVYFREKSTIIIVGRRKCVYGKA